MYVILPSCMNAWSYLLVDLREHALFVTRNLLLRNPANQAIVAEMDPVGVISETGELLPLPERMRRQQHANVS